MVKGGVVPDCVMFRGVSIFCPPIYTHEGGRILETPLNNCGLNVSKLFNTSMTEEKLSSH